MSEGSESAVGTVLGWVFLAILAFAGYGAFMAFQALTHPKPVLADYSASRERGTREFVPLLANPRKVILKLKTSWIPGDQKTGILRYVIQTDLSAPSGDAFIDSVFLNRISMCSLSIDLVDRQGFKLAKIPVTSVHLVDENQNTTALSDSDFIAMSRETYESIGGAWSPTWDCN